MIKNSTTSRSAFHMIKKFCEICNKQLILTTNTHIKRKRFCSVSCRMKGTNIKRLAKPVANFHRCRKCGETKPVSDFYTVAYKHKNHPRQFCIKCWKIKTYDAFAKHPEYQQQMKANKKKKRDSIPFDYERAYRLGWTLEKATEVYNAQNGRCAICKTKYKNKLALDHNHKTGKPRQFLCTPCNCSLAVLEDTVRMKKLQAYLHYHESK